MFSRFKYSKLAGISLLAVSMAAPPAMAQDASVDEVTVTGYRGSLAQAIDVKRNASGLVDAVVAEDIADMPDLNLAETLQRIPGISISRVNGEGRNITVRGLGSDFTRTRINGMEAMSTTGSTDSSGGANRGRGFDFNTFASELFNQLKVTKTNSASIEEGSLGATVDLRTAKPFDYEAGYTAVGSVQAGFNDLADEMNPRTSALASYSNDDKSFGVLLSMAYSDRKIVEEGFDSVRWQDSDFGSYPAGQSAATMGNNSGANHPRIPRFLNYEHDQERMGYTLSAQWAPQASTMVTFDYLSSSFDATRKENFAEFFLKTVSGMDVTSATVSGNQISQLTLNNPYSNVGGNSVLRLEGRLDELSTDFNQYTLNVEHDFSDTLKGTFLIGNAKSEHSNPVQTSVFFDQAIDVTGFSYDFGTNSNVPSMDFGNIDLTNPAHFEVSAFRDRPSEIDNTFDTIAADFEYKLNDDMSLLFGVNMKEYEHYYINRRRESGPTGGKVCEILTCADGRNGVAITSSMYETVSGFGDGLEGSGYPSSWISPDVNAVRSLLEIASLEAPIRISDNRTVKEEDTGFYAQIDFSTEVAGYPVRGDVGIREVTTDVTGTGWTAENGTTSQTTLEHSYDNSLPSLNLAIDASEDVIVRVGWAESLSRPSVSSLAPGGSLNTFSEPYSYNITNIDVAPFESTNTDLAIEWYFADESLLAVSFFDKELDSYNLASTSNELPFSQAGIPTSLVSADSTLGIALAAGQDPNVEINRKVNGSGANIDGYEIVYQQAFSNNTGIQFNYTKVDSDVIVGYSPNAYNATYYYEDEKVSARISVSDRDAYCYSKCDAGQEDRTVGGTTQWDFASSYAVDDSTELTFEVLNITDEEETLYVQNPKLVHLFKHSGVEYLIGVRKSFD